MQTLCPSSVLNEEQAWDLVEIVSNYDKTEFNHGTEVEMSEFRSLFSFRVPWYNTNCRQTIQACYMLLCQQLLRLNPNKYPLVVQNSKITSAIAKFTFAIAFFEKEYARAPEDN
jgi:predicted metal-binding protein